MPLWGPANPRWAGDATTAHHKRKRAQRRYKNITDYECARCPATARVRHHKDRDPGNNDPRNIEFLCHTCHAAEHASDRAHIAKRRRTGSIRARNNRDGSISWQARVRLNGDRIQATFPTRGAAVNWLTRLLGTNRKRPVS
jgi:MinD superfamily P-loop ATPase